MHYDYEYWPKRAKTKTWSELGPGGLGLTEGQLAGATNGRPERNKQWFLRVETESQDSRDRYKRGRAVYKRNPPACR